MVIGAYGDTVFEVSKFRVTTFRDFKRNSKANFAEHNTIGQPPKLEFLHRDLETISFEMTFHKSLGVTPFDEVQKLRDMCREGEADFLIIGNHAYGETEWIIESLSESVHFWDGKGKIYASKVDVNLKEYVREAD